MSKDAVKQLIMDEMKLLKKKKSIDQENENFEILIKKEDFDKEND